MPSQANLDADAQRRLQETAREAQRHRQVDQDIAKLSRALSSEKLSGKDGPRLTRQALAALVRLRSNGISPEEALARAIRSADLSATSSAKTSSYLQNLFLTTFTKITPPVLTALEAGEDPAPSLVLPPYRP